MVHSFQWQTLPPLDIQIHKTRLPPLLHYEKERKRSALVYHTIPPELHRTLP